MERFLGCWDAIAEKSKRGCHVMLKSTRLLTSASQGKFVLFELFYMPF
jgi:hypothetical protein